MRHADIDLLKGFYQSLKDSPLKPDSPYYEPYLEEIDPSKDPIAKLCTRIELSEAASVNLLSGQRGSGKSTGLLRLKQRLEEQGSVVFLCDMRDYLNLTTPVEISDFFIAVMGALSEAVEARYGKDPAREGFWERMGTFLGSEIELEGVTLKTGAGDIKAGLKDDPSFKKRLQQYLRGRVAKLVEQAHEFGADVVRYVRKRNGDADKQVVLLLDSIEQIRGVGSEAGDVYDSVENLFSAHADSLHLDLLHVVYTVPPYLITLAPGIGRYLGGSVLHNLPSVHVRNRDDSSDPQGLAVMEKIIARRCERWQQVFSSDQIRRMAVNTGGDLRDFFRLVRETLILALMPGGASLPIADAQIQHAENQLRREMLPIAEEDRVWLKKIVDSKEAELDSVKELPRLARFFDTNLVQNYWNGQEWYHIHPLIRDVIK